jgi:signal recognition particle subunit SRP54
MAIKKHDITSEAYNNMTDAEKKDTGILNASRRKRIAKGSGTTVQEINQLVNQYEALKGQMKKIMSNKGAFMKAAKKLGKDIDPEELKKMKF